MIITLSYRTIDRFSKTAAFKTLKGARRFAQKWMGDHPDVSDYLGWHAVDKYGVGTLRWAGCTASDLFD